MAGRGAVPMKIRRWRKMTWVLVVWCAGIVALAGLEVSEYHSHFSRCGQGCKELAHTQEYTAVVATFIVGAIGIVILGVLWFLTASRSPDTRHGAE